MNKIQKTILLTTAAVVVLMLIFPPWAITGLTAWGGGEVHGRAGTNHSFWLNPPSYKPLLSSGGTDTTYTATHVDGNFLLAELVILILIAGVLLIVTRKASPDKEREDAQQDDTA